jgi:hypothetical protein
MNYNLFLDDMRMPEDVFFYTSLALYNKTKWVIVRNYTDFVHTIESNGIPEIVSFDHDLADIHYKQQSNIQYEDDSEEKTGYHCARWMINYCLDNNLDIPKMNLIHSMNTVGALNIQSLFDTYNKIYPNGNN